MSKYNRIRLFILAIAGVIIGAILLVKAPSGTQTQIKDLTTISGAQLQKDKAYYAQQLFIIDVFAHMEDTSTQYYLALFFDQDDEAVAVNFVTKKSDPIYEKLNRYLEDDSQQIGDCVLDCYVKVSENTMANASDAKDLKQYFNDAVEEYENVLEMTFDTVDLRFSYLCDSSEDPYQALAKQSRSMALGAILILVVSAALLVVALLPLIRRNSTANAPMDIPMAVQQTPTASQASPQLANLESLHNAGILTDEEYNRKLRELN